MGYSPGTKSPRPGTKLGVATGFGRQARTSLSSSSLCGSRLHSSAFLGKSHRSLGPAALAGSASVSPGQPGRDREMLSVPMCWWVGLRDVGLIIECWVVGMVWYARMLGVIAEDRNGRAASASGWCGSKQYRTMRSAVTVTAPECCSRGIQRDCTAS